MTNALLPNPFNNIKQQMTKSIRAFSKDLAPSIYKAFKPIGPSGLILFHHKIRVRFSVVYKAVEVGEPWLKKSFSLTQNCHLRTLCNEPKPSLDAANFRLYFPLSFFFPFMASVGISIHNHIC
jgi:hypothetical protein